MKVLIIGEFSAFAKNLAIGINSIEGNEAIVFSYEDGFKKIQQDGESYTYPKPHNYCFLGIELRGSHVISGRFLYRRFKRDLSKFKSYFDAVFIISYTLLRETNNHSVPLFSKEDVLYAVKDPSKVFLSSCGGDIAYYKFALQDKRFKTVYKETSMLNNKLYKSLEKIASEIVSRVIPMSYQYHEAYRLFGSQFLLMNPIPLPFDSNSVLQKQSYFYRGKIVIFNGGLRPTKGNYFIDRALKKIEIKYKDKIIIRRDRMPYEQFLSFLKEIDIYIDLCTDYDYGMSAIAAMLAGCVVISGNEPETRRTMGRLDIPIISGCPDSEQLYHVIEDLILHPKKIEEIGRKSAKYAKEVHDCKILAPVYLKAFSGI